MIFIREDLIIKLDIDEKYLNFPELLYDDLWFSLDREISLFKSSRWLLEIIKVKIFNRIKDKFFGRN